MVEVATLEWGGEERKTGGRQRQPEREQVPCRAMLEPSSPASGEGRGEEGVDGERRSFLRHALSSKPPSSRQTPPSHAPLDTALGSQTAQEPGTCWQYRRTEQDLPGNW